MAKKAKKAAKVVEEKVPESVDSVGEPIPLTDLEKALPPKKAKKPSAKELAERVADLEDRNRQLQQQLDYYVRLNRMVRNG